MIRILFICHGNICRSPMAEFVFRDLAEKRGAAETFFVRSAATSTEELGNPVHPGTRRILAQHGISTAGKVSVRITKNDCDSFDHLVIMDENNRRNLAPFLENNGHKVSLLLNWCGETRAIADPWFTGNFEATYRDVLRGCTAMLDKLLTKKG